jgi:prepilin-type N-terminal cleavage/methylation domain-containing protein
MISAAARRRAHERGFTLIETIVALALMGLLLSALASITAQWLPSWNRGLDRIQRSELIGIALERIGADLAPRRIHSRQPRLAPAAVRWIGIVGHVRANGGGAECGAGARRGTSRRNQGSRRVRHCSLAGAVHAAGRRSVAVRTDTSW